MQICKLYMQILICKLYMQILICKQQRQYKRHYYADDNLQR